MRLIFCLLVFLASCLCFGVDRFQSLTELRQVYAEGRDFQRVVVNRSSPVAVVAIHGGSIELGTSEIARAIAGEDASLYLFESLLTTAKSSWDHHITSVNFDDPDAIGLVSQAQICFSIHGYLRVSEAGPIAPPTVMLGGLNANLRDLVARQLEDFSKQHLKGLIILNGTGRFTGPQPTNIVNRARHHGVQFELSRTLRDLLLSDRELLAAFARTVRQSSCEFMIQLNSANAANQAK